MLSVLQEGRSGWGPLGRQGVPKFDFSAWEPCWAGTCPGPLKYTHRGPSIMG